VVVSVIAIMADDDMNGADFQWADAGDVKKLQLH
jgi:hypothetical protein